METNYTQRLAEWVASLGYEDIPDACIAKAKEQLASVLGAILMSAGAPANRGVVQAVRDLDGHGPSSIIGSPYSVSPGNAAVANSFAAQLFEFEDWVYASHAGASVVPTALAMAEMTGATGKDLLAAVVIGTEMAGRTGRAMIRGAYVGNSMPNHQVDTALVAGRLLGLDSRRLQHALGLNCFMAMESCPVGYLTDAKGLINSLPASTGILSAVMAKHGVIGNLDIVEHPAGYLWTVSEVVDLDELINGLGEDWVIPTLRSKPFPICGYNIAAVEAALQLVHSEDLQPSDIREVQVFAPASTLYAGTRFHALEPDVFTQIKLGTATHMPLLFDVPYPMAAAIFDRELTPRQYDSAHIEDARIRDLAARIKLSVDGKLNDAYYKDFKFGSRVVMRLTDGRTIENTVEEMPGAPSNPFDIDEKFMRGAGPALGQNQAEEALGAIKSVDAFDDVRVLGRLLRTSESRQN